MPADQSPVFDPDIVARYDVSGPRYTSYPTAPQFTETFGEDALRAAAKASNAGAMPLSLYVHVPFCFSPCFYCGCTRIITRDRRKAADYLARLKREIELTAPLFDRARRVAQLHFGGGTPNFLDAAQVADLMQTLHRHFTAADSESREFGIEIDPRYADRDYVRMLAAQGFNRMSVGIQDFDPAVQAAVNRMQSFDETRAVLEAAREHGFRSLSVDLIYGLPRQTQASFARSLEQVIALKPDRIATYGYAHLPERFRAQRQIDKGELPDATTRLALLRLIIETLTAAGYRYIGMDHFARPDDDLARAQRGGTLQRNFQGYSTNASSDLIGLGVSAIGHIADCFSQNAANLIEYYGALDRDRLPVKRGMALKRDDVIRGDLIQRLMCLGTIDIAGFETAHQLDFAGYFAEECKRLDALAADGLVAISPQEIAVTPRGRLLLRNVAMCFDAYLYTPNPTTQYSKAL